MKVQVISLEQIAKIYAGVSVKRESASPEFDGCPLVRVEDLNNGIVRDTSRRLDGESAEKARIAPPGTVLFSRTGTVGKVGIAGEAMAPSSNIIAVEFDRERVDPLYGMYCLQAFRTEFLAEARGAVYDSLSLAAFRKFEIPVPELEVQRELAGKLSRIKETEEQTRENEADVRTGLSELFAGWFAEEISRAEAYYGKPGAECLTLGRCAEITFSTAGKSRNGEGEETAYITTGLLHNWEIRLRDAAREVVDEAAASKCTLHPGDLVMNRINQINHLGHCGIVSAREKDAGVNPAERIVFGLNTVRVRADKKRIVPQFLLTWLSHPFIRHYIKENAKTSTSFQSSLSRQVLEEIPVPDAAYEKQKRFAREAEKCFAYAKKAEQILEFLEKLRQINFKKIKTFYESAKEQKPKQYEQNRYWIAPSGKECFYDLYLESIQVPFAEWQNLKVSDLPYGMEIQFLEKNHLVSEPGYGNLGHIRLKRLEQTQVQVIRMEPVAPGETETDLAEGLVSEQQDFGYIRKIRVISYAAGAFVSDILGERVEEAGDGKEYSRAEGLSVQMRKFLGTLSSFQQAVYEEFLLAMQPLACHMAYRQITMREENASQENHPGRRHGIQDVTAAVHMLEHAGLLEKREGFYLNYYREYGQGEERKPILDHRGRPIPIDTWVWVQPKEY